MSPAVTVRFSEAVVGVWSGSFYLRQGSSVVPATVTYVSATAAAVLRPVRPLAPNTIVSATLASTIFDTTGNALAFTTWSFKTAWWEAYSPTRTLTFAPGTYTGYRFSSTGAVTSTRAYTLSQTSTAPTSQRSAVAGQTGGWYYVTSGVWAGYWIREATTITLS